jgi:hypothetical protein
MAILAATARILVIETDVKTANAIRTGLRGEGAGAAVARTGEDGFFNSTPTVRHGAFGLDAAGVVITCDFPENVALVAQRPFSC